MNDNYDEHRINSESVVHLNFLSQAIDDISKSKSMEEISDIIFDFISSIIIYQMAIIYVIDYEKNELEVLSARGSNLNHMKKRVKFKVGKGVVGWVAQEKKAVIIKDALKEEDIKVRQHFEIDPVICSFMAIPLITSNKLIGILSISSPEPNLYNARDAQLISIIASQAAALIEINKLLIRAQKFSDNILECANSGIIAINDKTEIVVFNKEAERITGYDGSHFIGEKLTDLPLKNEDDRYLILETFLNEKPFTEFETYIVNKDNIKIPISVSTSILEDENEQKIGATCIFRDISKIKMLQEQVSRAERLAVVGECMAGIAHEIRNPLLPIRTAASVLFKKDTLDVKDKKLIKIIYDESERLNDFINNLMYFVRPALKEGEYANILVVFDDIFELVKYKCRNHKIKVTVIKESENMHVKLSSDRLKQVFLNLFLNSIDAIGSEGEITITLKERKNDIELIFSDTGCGIPEDDIKRVFDPFYTSKENGTGLGLSIINNITHNAGGSVQAFSEVGKGTEFKITLPKAEDLYYL
ncbi:MAG TPA: GAF domain-containing protein [Thermoanaerobacterales bacterium]|nr:GAF domain-containing protein [Thermoanaerobacterales bacterium]